MYFHLRGFTANWEPKILDLLVAVIFRITLLSLLARIS